MTVYAALREAFLVVDDAPTATLTGHDFECVAVHPDRPERVFVGTFGAGLHRSTDGGRTFERVGVETIDPGEGAEHAARRGAVPDGVSVMSAAVNPRDPKEVWVGTEPSALFHSTDGGTTFEAVGDLAALRTADEWAFPPRPYTHHVRWIEPDPHAEGRLYVGVEAGALLVTDDRGATWTERPPGSRRDNHSLATHPDAAGRVYSAAGDGYAESTDAGERWEHPQDGLEHRYVWSVAVDPADPDTVLVSAATGASAAHGHGGAASAESHVYRRRGGAFERVGDGLPVGEGVLRAVLAPAGPGEFYAANNRGLYRTADAGDSWAAVAGWADRYGEQTVRGLAAV
jgi:photosystem II stability/assembly factor-like uncharacterized protein